MDRRHRWLKHAPVVGGLLLVVLLVSGLAWFIHGFMAYKTQTPERVQEITLIRPPPPPPPETPPPPPPPEKVEQTVQQKQPDPTPDKAPAPPQQQLGLDATATAGGDSFGLMARQGGADLVGTGGAAFAWYTGKIKDAVSERLTADAKLHARKFTVSIRLWITADGHIKQVRLTGSSGNRTIDGEISAALDSMGGLDEPPPLEMPQPVTLQIVGHS